MKLKFDKIRPPNFAITDKGKFSLAELDHNDFLEYVECFRDALINRRIEQIQQKEIDASLGADE